MYIFPMSGILSWKEKVLQIIDVCKLLGIGDLNVKLDNLADGFLKHCSHMLSEKVHLMQLLFPISWITVTNKKDTVLKIWSVFIAVKLLLGCFHTNGDDSRQITNQNRENCSSKVTPPEKFLPSVSLEFGNCLEPRS